MCANFVFVVSPYVLHTHLRLSGFRMLSVFFFLVIFTCRFLCKKLQSLAFQNWAVRWVWSIFSMIRRLQTAKCSSVHYTLSQRELREVVIFKRCKIGIWRLECEWSFLHPNLLVLSAWLSHVSIWLCWSRCTFATIRDCGVEVPEWTTSMTWW